MPATYATTVDLLLDHLDEHEREEANVLGRYRAAADSSPDAGVRFLMRLIVEDEQRHHAWMAAAASSIRELLRQGTADALPPLGTATDANAAILTETDEFIQAERQALAGLKALRRTVEWAGGRDRALFRGREVTRPPAVAEWMKGSPMHLLVELMIEDTKRHIRVLDEIGRRLLSAERAASRPSRSPGAMSRAAVALEERA